MKVKIVELRERMLNSLVKRGLSQFDAKLLVDAFVEAEMTGKKTHGIGKIFMLDKPIKNVLGTPKIIKDKGNYALVDGNKTLGHTSADMATDILIKKVKEFDNAFVAVTNSYYYSMASIYAKKVADAGYVAIILNNGGPATISPFGGNQPITGTNPIAIGIPCSAGSIVLDMTTGEKPWGEVNLAKVEKRSLQEKTFYNEAGVFTTDPADVSAIIPFGGYKGYGLNFMFEILTGAFVSAKMGLQSMSPYDLGFFFMAFSSEMFTTKEKFDQEILKFIEEVKSSRKVAGVDEIYLPGEKSAISLKKAESAGEIEIDTSVWERLLEYEKGEDVMSNVGLKT